MSDLHIAVERTADAAADLLDGIEESLTARGWSVATAESLTGGTIATVLTAGPGAAAWFRGSIVAYDAEVKFGLLGVPRGPVVTEECAATMARSTARLLGADLCVAVTGVGGPAPDEGQEPGTVWIAVSTPDGVWTEKLVIEGDPAQVLTRTTAHALALLRQVAGQDGEDAGQDAADL